MPAAFNKPGAPTVGAQRPTASALGIFAQRTADSIPASGYGYLPTRPGRRVGLGSLPALTGLFRAGRVLGVSQVNLMATNVWRGSGA